MGNLRQFSTGMLLLLFTSSAVAFKLDFQFTDAQNLPVTNAVVSLLPSTPQARSTSPPNIGKMRQRNREFLPYVLPVQRNTPVVFPNEDPFQHHVYSFSATKRFEVKLFSGVNKSPIVFDKTGVATLGCNIHDWMIGYIVVVDTPYFDKSGATGHVVFTQLPADTYQAEIWHPRLSQQLTRRVVFAANADKRLQIQLKLTNPPKAEPPSADSDDDFDYDSF